MKKTRRCRSGQATVEMAIRSPLLLALIGGGILVVFSCWQGIKVQQGANLAARIQGEERVSASRTPQERLCALRDRASPFLRVTTVGGFKNLRQGEEVRRVVSNPMLKRSAHERKRSLSVPVPPVDWLFVVGRIYLLPTCKETRPLPSRRSLLEIASPRGFGY